MDYCGNAAALSRHYFFPCPLEFVDEIQRLAHVATEHARCELAPESLPVTVAPSVIFFVPERNFLSVFFKNPDAACRKINHCAARQRVDALSTFEARI